MNEENKEFYTEGCDTEVVDLQIEAFDELVEDIMLEALKHMSAKEKLDQKKYRLSAKGKKALAKHLKKIARAGYKVDKKRSKLMQKVADFRKEDVSEEELLNFDVNDAALCEAIYEILEAEEIAELDALIEEVIAFAEACKEGDEDLEIDPETGDDEEDLEEGFKHMTATAKAKARKYRMSAAGKKALKKYLKKSSRAGYKVDKKRSKLMTKVGAFARHEAEDMAFAEEFGLSESELNKLDDFIGSILLNAKEISEAIQSEEDVDIFEAIVDENEIIAIEVPVESSDDFEKAVETAEVEVVSHDEENGIAVVKGVEDALRAFLDELGYDDPIEDLACELEDDEEINEAFHHMTAAKKLAAKKYRMSSQGKKAMKKYLKKISRAGYKVDKQRSKLMKKVAMFRNEAIQESLDSQFAATPLFESLNEAESNELKGIVFNAVSQILNQSYDKIAEDVTKEYESYMNEEVMPEMCALFEEYSAEIVKNLNENVEEYMDYVAEEIKNELADKNLIVKSQKTEALESFSEDLLALIKDKLNILPEQEDVLFKNQETIEKLSEDIQEAKIETAKMRNKLEEAKREIYVLKNIPAELSELQKENLHNYVNDVLSEAEDFEEFSKNFDKAVNEALSYNEEKKETLVEEKKEESKKVSSFFDSIMNSGKSY